MEEKVLIASERYDTGKIIKTIIYWGIGLIAFGILFYAFNINGCRLKVYHDNYFDSYYEYPHPFFDDYLAYDSSIFGPTIIYGGLGALLIAAFIAWLSHSFLLTVTDKRIYGKTIFGKQVDLPVDSVSAISTNLMKGIAVATSSGKISFLFIKNRDDIKSIITDMIIERQKKEEVKTPTIISAPVQPSSNTDDLRELKALLDDGIITQGEFDAKKKQVLGL